jgi:alpha-tubulin suppressor-like RCC1 family protein
MPLNEGQTVQYTVNTTNTADGTVLYWKTTGNTTNSDIVSGNTGSITITNNQAVFNVTLITDESPDGTKTLGISLSTGSLNGPTVVTTPAPIVINDTSNFNPNAKTLYVMGSNPGGQLGFNNTVYRSSPTQLGTAATWNKIYGSNDASMATKTDGTLWTWGSNSGGGLGLNDTVNRSSPVQVGTGTNWSQLASGSDGFRGAIKTDGTLWLWGTNSYGQLGQGDSSRRSSPTQVGTGWSSMSVGQQIVAAIKTNGTLWTWGRGRFGTGDLGLNDNGVDRNSPTQIGTDTNWSVVSSAGNNGAAIKTNGTLWTWGNNAYGQLGFSNNDARSSPTQVGALTNWSSITCNGRVTAAIKNDNTLWLWGDNTYGVLGLNYRTSSSSPAANFSPTQIGTASWSKVSSSKDGTKIFAIKADGTLWSWGRNFAGELGLNDVVHRSSPVQVGTGNKWLDVEASGSVAFATETP